MPKRILLTADQMEFSGTGLYHYTLELVEALLALKPQDYEFHFLLSKRNKGEKFFGDTVSYHTKTLFNKLKWKTGVRFDLVHFLHQHPRALFPHKIKGKKLMTVHDLNFLYEFPKDSGPWEHFFQHTRRLLKNVDRIITISEFAATDLYRMYNDMSHKKIKVIHNGINLPKAMPEMPDTTLPLFSPARPFLFALGTVLMKKNFHVLPGALKYTGFDLVIAGRTDDHAAEYRNLLMEECTRFGVDPGRLHILGEVSEHDKIWYYKHCEAFVFPSIAEGFGAPPIDAMYYQKPVFVSRRTAIPEICGDGAYYFENFSPEHMGAVINNGIQDFQQFPGKKEAAGRQVRKFSWEKAAAEYLAVYQEMLG